MLTRQDILRSLPAARVWEREPMRRHTSFAIGGPADLLALPLMPEELLTLLLLAGETDTPVLLMGNGSNLLVSDKGIRGLVIKTHDGLGRLERTGECEITAGAGLLLSRLAVAAQRWGLSGLAFAHGIPGTVGGAVYMNAGAYDGEMSRVVVRTSYLDATGTPGVLEGEAHGFAYRRSFFSEHPDHVALETVLRLSPGDPDAIRADMEELSARRRASQPLDKPSAGSVFKRPPGGYAGTLIDACGLKGAAVGGARVSEKHAGFIINTGDAACEDVLGLIELIRERVFAHSGVRLEPEIKLVGEL